MTTTEYAVTGMTCEHCVRAVQSEIGELPGVRAVDVKLAAGAVTSVAVTADPQPSAAAVATALDAAGGYQLRS